MRRPLPRWSPGHDELLPSHVGLAYDKWGPVETSDADCGFVSTRATRGMSFKSAWLDSIGHLEIDPDYEQAFNCWCSSFDPHQDQLFEVETASRLLIGHGNPSVTEVGLTVHHTWGVPIIPGSALKGLTASYLQTAYGPENPGNDPWSENDESEKQRADFRGVLWKGARIRRGPGQVYRALFGSPEAEEDALVRQHGVPAGATRGLVTFHDALMVPRGKPEHMDQPFAVDVLTVHQKEYYKSLGTTEPNDYDDPIPVQFLSVRPRTHFLIALSGPAEWRVLAAHFLREALEEWGIGGKTSSNYGRIGAWSEFYRPSDVVRQFEDWLKKPSGDMLVFKDGDSKPTKKSILGEIERAWLAKLRALAIRDRATAAARIEREFTAKNVRDLAKKLAGHIRE